jgi:hypothetical protein
MAEDALDPGPGGDYPHWPRRPDGTPDDSRMPAGLHRQDGTLIDLTPRHPPGHPLAGQPIVPPNQSPGG